MDTSGVGGNIPVNPPSGPSGPPSEKDVEAMMIAALLSIMGVNQAFLQKYMGSVQDAEKWVKWALGLKGVVNSTNAGELTNQQLEQFAEGYQQLEERLKAYEKKYGDKNLPPAMQSIKTILGSLKGIYEDLVALNKAENPGKGKAIDLEAVKEAREKVLKDVTALTNPTTPEGKNALNILKNNINQLVQTLSTPAMIYAKQAMHFINQINNLAVFTSSMMKKVQQASEMIWQLTLK